MGGRTCVSLFSGIGGFERAAEANGFTVLAQVEIDKDCQAYLRKVWPNAELYDDIKTFPAEKYRGADLVMGGPPCQPVSVAGKQKGQEDERWLWGETLAVVEAILPRWCLFENPPAIRTMGLDGILSHLENLGYTTGTVDIPACSVDAPHIRARYWIVAYRMRSRPGVGGESEAQLPAECLQGSMAHNDKQGPQGADSVPGAHGLCSECAEGYVEHSSCGWRREGGNTGSKGQGPRTIRGGGGTGTENLAPPQSRGQRADGSAPGSTGHVDECGENPWSNHVWFPCADGKVRRAPDDTFGVANECSFDLISVLAEEGWPKRSVLKALGNSIVSAVAAEVIRAMVMAEVEE